MRSLIFTGAVYLYQSSAATLHQSKLFEHFDLELEREPPKQTASSPSAEEKPSKPPPGPSPPVLEPARTDTYNFRFSADKNFKEKFERLAGRSWP
jgi:hypothetical protein